MVERITFDKFIGTTLGTYRLEQLIEQSKPGPLFLARSTSGATTYVVRFLAAPAQLTPEARIVYLGRFQQEANQVSALRHPYILPLLDYGNYQGMPYLVMPHLSLISLYAQLKQSGPPDLLTVSRYLDQIAAALDYAHQQAVLHRNLTTHSILLENNKTLVIADFGVMRMLELSVGAGSPQAYALYGSSEASAPEIAQNKSVDIHTDIYALGGVLYRLLTAHSVFRGKIREEVVQRHLQAPVPPLSKWRSDVPAAVDSIIAMAMAKDPAQRFNHAGELANAYHQLVAPNDTARPMLPPPLTPAPRVTVSSASGRRNSDFAPTMTRKGTSAVHGRAGDDEVPLRSPWGGELSRRRFMIVAGVGVTAVVAAGFVGSRFLGGNTSSAPPVTSTGGNTPASANPQSTPAPQKGGTVLARTSDIPLNSAKKITVPGSSNPGVLIHLPDNQFVAFDAICTHAGCTVDYIPQAKILKCPCHDAIFDPARKAAVVSGPAPTPLPPVKIQVHADGTITTG